VNRIRRRPTPNKRAAEPKKNELYNLRGDKEIVTFIKVVS
jgi:hypothetical protein